MDNISLIARLPDAIFPDVYTLLPCRVKILCEATLLWWAPDQRVVIGGMPQVDDKRLRCVDLSSQFVRLDIPDDKRLLFPIGISVGEAKRTMLGPHPVGLYEIEGQLSALVLRSQLWAVCERLGID